MCFFFLNAIRAIRGQNGLIFEQKGPFGFYQEAFRGHFSNSTKHVLQKSLFRDKFWGKIAQNSRLGVFFLDLERKKYSMKNLWALLFVIKLFYLYFFCGYSIELKFDVDNRL